MKKTLLCLLSCWLGTVLTAMYVMANIASGTEPLRVWPADIHTKVFADAVPGQSGPVTLSAARNEYESGQFAVYAEMTGEITLAASPLTHEDGKTRLPADTLRLRPVDAVPIKGNTPDAESIITRKAPCDMPDILRETSTFPLQKGTAKGVWVTVFVPKTAKPGLYNATITVTGGDVKATLPLKLKVFTFTLPEERHLWVTNWFLVSNFAKYHKVEIWSEDFWPVLEKYFRNMAAHRQNVILAEWVPNGGLVRATRKKDGSWHVDFSRLERYLSLAEKCGVCERIEFWYGASIRNQKVTYVAGYCFDEASGKSITVPLDQWFEPTLAALEKWLIKTKRIDKAMIHIADEPQPSDVPSWREASARLHEAAPKIKRIDAIEGVHFTDALEVWVPKLSHFDRWRDAYEARRAHGEFWYYICCHPTGIHYPNRLMDLPATRVHALHWVNYSEDLCGYLHWGLNFWPVSPFGSPTTNYCPGDSHTIYPGPLDSIRWEIERESIEDYEYLVLLENLTAKIKKESKADLWWLDPKSRSKELARRIVPTLVTTSMDPATYAETRAELVRELEAFTNGPRLIVQTFPGDNAVIYSGPNLIEINGLTTPGAKVTIGGKDVAVDSNGTFRAIDRARATGKIEITATLDGRVTKTVRSYEVH